MNDQQKWIQVSSGELPAKKPGWNHSEQVLLHYPSIENDKVEAYGVGYYNYDPPFEKPLFIDFHHYGRTPDAWMPIVKYIQPIPPEPEVFAKPPKPKGDFPIA